MGKRNRNHQRRNRQQNSPASVASCDPQEGPSSSTEKEKTGPSWWVREVKFGLPRDSFPSWPFSRELVLILVIRHGILGLSHLVRTELWPRLVRLNRRLGQLAIDTRAQGWACDFYVRPSFQHEHLRLLHQQCQTISNIIQRNATFHRAQFVRNGGAFQVIPPPPVSLPPPIKSDLDPADFSPSDLWFSNVNLGLRHFQQRDEKNYLVFRAVVTASDDQVPDLVIILRRGLLTRLMPRHCARAFSFFPLMDPLCRPVVSRLLRAFEHHDSSTIQSTRSQLLCWRSTQTPSQKIFKECSLASKSKHLDRDSIPSISEKEDLSLRDQLQWWGKGLIAGAQGCPIIRLNGEKLKGSRSTLLYWLSFEAQLQDHWDLVPLCFPLKREWRDALLLLTAVPWPWSRVTLETRFRALELMLDPDQVVNHFRSGEKGKTRMGGPHARRRLLRHLTWMTFHHEVSPDCVLAINDILHRCFAEGSFGASDLSGGLGQLRSCHGNCEDWSYVLWFLHHANEPLWRRALQEFHWDSLHKFCSGTDDQPPPGRRDRSKRRSAFTGKAVPSRDRLWRICRPFSTYGGWLARFWGPEDQLERQSVHLVFPHVRVGRAITRWLSLPLKKSVDIARGALHLEKWLLWDSSPRHPDDTAERMEAFRHLIRLHHSSGPISTYGLEKKKDLYDLDPIFQLSRKQRHQELLRVKLREREGLSHVLFSLFGLGFYSNVWTFQEDIRVFRRTQMCSEGFDPLEHSKLRKTYRWSHLIANWTWLQHVMLEMIEEYHTSCPPLSALLVRRLDQLADLIYPRQQELRKVSGFLSIR